MKKLTMSILIALVATAGAQTFEAPAHGKKTVAKATKKQPAPLPKQQVRGVLARAFQPGGNPFQMINPKAPPEKYGTAEEHVVLDPDTGKWKGIKLLSFNF
jgi:hypothetical protein